MTNQVHAPYHFVPLSKWVYMPDWAHLVSHDVPFKDGYSGSIDYTLTNVTPLLVGGEQERKEGQAGLVKWARDPLGQPVIPGSSLKGMIRNVLEIATFGKFSAIDDNHFSNRDLSNAESHYAKTILDSKTQSYWLKYESEKQQWTLRKTKYTVLFHDEFNRYSHCKIENIAFKQPSEDKFKYWPLSKPPISFRLTERSIEGTKGKMVNVMRADELGSGDREGYPVFTSFRPGNRKYTPTRLNFSYIFYGTESESQTFTSGDELANKLFSNHNESLVNYLKNNPHPEYGIPVFSKQDKKGKILALGFAQMPRMLYDKSVSDVAKTQQRASSSECVFDMSELLFGTLREKAFSLKSRIYFPDATCQENKGISPSSPVILGQPKASYLPAYLEQPGAGNDSVLHVTSHKDLSQYDNQSELAGWKRYPSRNHFDQNLPDDLKNKANIQTKLELMKPNSHFIGKVLFNNLKTEELGALIWILQLGAEDSKALHSLGHGKSLGAGAVKLILTNFTCLSNQEKNQCTSTKYFADQFVAHMNEVYPHAQQQAWVHSPQIRHLMAFADIDDNDEKDLSYMPLKPDKNGSLMSYTESVKGRDKQVLPKWTNEEKTLNRQEEINSKIPPTKSFGQGRLAGLIYHQKENNLLSMYDTSQLESIHKLQKAAAFESLSDEEKTFINLKEKLAPFANIDTPQAKQGRQSCNSDIESLLDACLSNQIEATFMQDFYDISRNKKLCAYLDLASSKKNKATLKSRKIKLTNLLEKYNLLGAQ